MFKNVGSLLTKFSTLTPPKRLICDACISVVKEIIGVTLHKHECDVQRGTIHLKTHPTVKSEVLAHKAEILRELQNKLGVHKNTVRDIK
jgi:hypothetical protein|tara:strand:+ start:756 stop:1022 length:267 start_codon:yes stop_codon:yes gene_type:complete